MPRLFHPEIFQGRLNQRHYFEGWYFKHVSADGRHVLSVIPGVALTDDDPHGFIQVLNGTTAQTWNIRYPLSDCRLSSSTFDVRIGRSTFSARGIHLDIDRPELQLTGDLAYSQMVRFPSSVWKPGIMGPFTFMPRMECKHGVISIRHAVDGHVLLQGATLTFDQGTGYIEKDWGRSFPQSWIWAQGNTFAHSDASFMFSVAKIPWLGRFFIGFVAYLYVPGQVHLFATYNRATIDHLRFDRGTLRFTLRQAGCVLTGTVHQRTSAPLHAPVAGVMDRMIKESADSDIDLILRDRRGRVLFAGQGTHAGLEIIEGILKHFPG